MNDERKEFDTPTGIGLFNPSGEALSIANMGLVLHAMSVTCSTLARQLDQAEGVERAALLVSAGREFRHFADLAHDTGREFHEIGSGYLPRQPDEPRRPQGRDGLTRRFLNLFRKAST